jgi:uncharacterized membrane protein YhiD involved in acid resistance
METKKRTTLFIESEIMDTIKLIAINKDITQTKIINEYLKQGIEKEPQKNKSKIRFIVKPNPNKNIDDLIGSIKTEKPVNAVKLINEVRRGE